MTNNRNLLLHRFLQGLFWCILILLVATLLASWVLSVRIDGIEGLLTPRGIRWLCSHILPNFAAVPLAKIMLGLMALSVLRDSGLFHVARRHISLKQRRALQITLVASLLVVSLFSLLLVLPGAVLLSAFGTVSHSAFAKGLLGLLLSLAIFVGNVYGYTSGRFVTVRDFVHAHVTIFPTVAPYFVILFLASQLVGCLQFTGILSLLGNEDTLLLILRGLFYNIPLLLYVLLAL